MKNPFLLLPIVFTSAMFLVSCSHDTSSDVNLDLTEAKIEVIDVEPGEAAKLVSEGTVVVLDVRTPGEYQGAHIANAALVDIRGEGFDQKIAELDQSKPYLVHCAAGIPGGRSRKAVDALKKAGATKIYHLEGGIGAWMLGNHPVEKAETP